VVQIIAPIGGLDLQMFRGPGVADFHRFLRRVNDNNFPVIPQETEAISLVGRF